MRIAIGSDHAGFELKTAMKGFVAELHHEPIDVGTYTADPVDYVEYAASVGAALRESRAERGILLCGSGVGASMAANRIPGVRAGLCHDTYSAHQGVEHDDMNVLVLGGRVIGVELARELVGAFLNARFAGGERHVRRLAKLISLENPLRGLQVFGQSVWLDYIRRSLICSGELHLLIDEDGLRGVTSNPAIFEKAVAGSSDYKEAIESPAARTLDAKTLYETLAIRDVQDAADLLRSVYDRTARRDGYVSLEVSPLFAHDTPHTLGEARRLWREVGRENLMIKVPATREGVAAIRELVGEGINVNATLLFAQDAYEQVAEAYIAGLETFVARGGDPRRVASVASFFVGRIDTAIDALIAERLSGMMSSDQEFLRSLSGKVAIANAKLAYQRYREIVASSRWKALAALGAQTQRLLWASTGTKNAAYRDVVYVEELIGSDTVTTIPPATLDAFRDHGRPRSSLLEDVESARDTMDALAQAGISITKITDALLTDGVRLFSDAFEQLLGAIDAQRRAAGAPRPNRVTSTLPRAMTGAVDETLQQWRADGKVRRLWARDATLWTGKDEARWLGWLGITNGQLAHLQRLTRVREVARSAGFSHVLLLGMGGSSLCPEVLRTTFGRVPGYPELHVLDSTDPAQVKTLDDRIDLRRTLFIVSSKSGSTLEPNILKQHFFERVKQMVGAQEAGNRFIAITDPGSRMQHLVQLEGFRRVFFGWPDIGGRYSALSDFGLVPAAIMGVDVAKFLNRAEQMVYACMPPVPVDENPGVMLGAVLGVAASRFGRDKVTILCSPGIGSLGIWLEQLIAESTGKDGKGLLPIAREAIGPPDIYGADRIFVYLRLLSAPDPAQDAAIDALQRAGQPVVRIGVADEYDLAQEFFRWEFAVAVASSILGIHPFDQPDVEASKIATRKLTDDYERHGALPRETPIFTGGGIELFADEKNAAALAERLNRERSLTSYLRAHLARLGTGDYFALLAYIEMSESLDRALQATRHAVRDARRVATCVEYGPRFLHSTGQYYKGGTNNGVFLQITCDDAVDVPIPDHRYTFGIVKAAQARGDLQVLVERERRVLRVHLGADVGAGLAALHHAIVDALAAGTIQQHREELHHVG
jgi:transaldolase / glucose-6-phosphate isomerase